MLLKDLKVHVINTVRMMGAEGMGLGKAAAPSAPGALRGGGWAGGSAGSGEGSGWRAGEQCSAVGTLCIRRSTQGQRDFQVVKSNHHGNSNSSSIFSGSSVTSLNSSL